MTPAHLAGLACVMGLALATPPRLTSQSQSDSIIIHSIYAGEPLLKLLTGVAAEAKGAFLPEEAERIHRDAWGLAATARDYNYPPRRMPWSYSYLVRGRDNAKAILAIRLLSTQPYVFDVSIGVPDARLMKAIRAVAAKVEVDSLLPIDRIRLVLKEERGTHQPRLVLSMATVRQFRCVGRYYIDYDMIQDADTIRLNLHGVGTHPDPCTGMAGPATMSRELHLGHRDYALYVTYRDRTDRLFFDISDSMTVVTGRDSSLAEADERPRLRYPRNSFAFRCGTGERERALCHAVDTWLARQPGISRYTFPGGAINPYGPPSAGRTEEEISFFRYDHSGSYEYLRLCFGAIDTAIREAVGVSLSLEDWLGKYITAQSQRRHHERHIDAPGSVTELSACRTPSWRE